MKKTYVIMPTEWDYDKDTLKMIPYLRNHGCIVPCDITNVSERCGALVGVALRQATTITKELKKDYPYVKFELLVGETWGELKLIKTF